MNCFKNILLLLSLFICKLAAAQQIQTQDSLKNIIENENLVDSIRFNSIEHFYKLFTASHPEVSLKLTEYHTALSKSKKNKLHEYYALRTKARIYYLKGELNQSMRYLNKGLELSPYLENETYTASMHSNKGVIYDEKNEYFKAIKNYNHALNIYEKEGQQALALAVKGNLGFVFQRIGNYDLAMRYYKQVLNVKDENNQTQHVLLNIGEILYIKKEYPKSMDYVRQSIKAAKQFRDRVAIADCYFLTAKTQLALNKKDSALYYVRKSFQTDGAINNKLKNLDRNVFEARLMLDTDLNKATQQAEEIEKQVDSIGNNTLKASVYELLYECYKKQGRAEKSLRMHELYNEYNNLVVKEKTDFSIVRAAVENELKDELLANKKKQNQLKYKLGFILLGALLLFFGILLFTKKKNKKEKDKLLSEIEVLKQKKSVHQQAEAKKENKHDELLITNQTGELDRKKLEDSIGRKLNETDWNVLLILLENPVISNKDIAQRAFKSVDGIGSSLRRMYEYFEISKTKYKKIALLTEAIKISKK